MKNVVLTFHNVTNALWFENVLRLLGFFFDFGTLDQLYARLNGAQPAKRRMCFITFDDGERSVYEVVFPILQRMNIPAAMFVSPLNITEGGAFWFQRMRELAPNEMEQMKCFPLCTILQHIEELDPMGTTNRNTNINLQMFDELKRSGLITFGAHTQHHPILANESDEVSYAEITDSIAGLEKLLNAPVKYFAYPNGSRTDFTEREIQVLCANNIKMVFSTIPGYAANKDLFRIQRIGLSKGSRIHIIMKLLFPKLVVYLRDKRCDLRRDTTK